MKNHMGSFKYVALQLLWRGKGFLAQFPAQRFPRSHFYIISHERSGTHYLINTILQNAHIRRGYGLGVGAGWGWHNIGEWFGPYDQPEHRFDHIQAVNSQWARLPARAAIIKSHCDRALFEKEFISAPVIYIHRDPRDTLLSWYHYLHQARLYRIHPYLEDHRCPSFSAFIRRPATDFLKWNYSLEPTFDNVVERWAAHVKGWLEREDPNTLVIRFRHLKSGAADVLQEIRKLTGIELRSDFRPAGLLRSESMLPRKGIVGDWKNAVSPADEQFIRETVEQSGLAWSQVTGR